MSACRNLLCERAPSPQTMTSADVIPSGTALIFTSRSPHDEHALLHTARTKSLHGHATSIHHARTQNSVTTSTLSSNPWHEIAARKIPQSIPGGHACLLSVENKAD